MDHTAGMDVLEAAQDLVQEELAVVRAEGCVALSDHNLRQARATVRKGSFENSDVADGLPQSASDTRRLYENIAIELVQCNTKPRTGIQSYILRRLLLLLKMLNDN